MISSPLLCADTIYVCDTLFELPVYWAESRIPDSILADISELAPLPPKYSVHGGRIYLLRPARDAFLEIAKAAEAAGLEFVIESGYRSIEKQEEIWCTLLGMGVPFESIIKGTAPPGYSEHHTGRAVDFYPTTGDFVGTREYWWLKRNAGKYGWRQSYTTGEGVRKEPWHWYFEDIKEIITISDSI